MNEYEIKWKFITHTKFVRCGPYSTDGYSVGLQNKGESMNSAIWGEGENFNAAVEAALRSERGKEFVAAFGSKKLSAEC